MLKFQDLLNQNNPRKETILLVHFQAEWSGTAFLMRNILKNLKVDFPGKIQILDLDVTEEPGLVEELSIVTIPTIVLIQGRQIQNVFRGILSKQILEEEIRGIIKKI